MRVSRTRAAATVVSAAACGVIVGGGALAFASSNTTDNSPASGDAPAPAKVVMADGRDANALTKAAWPSNEFGLTYGQPTLADIEEGNLPDLKPFLTDAGEEGFLLTKNFYFPLAKNSHEAKAQTDALVNDEGDIVVKVYEADGTTLIGTKVAGTTKSE